jgi:chemotaxis protein MotB
MAKKAPAGAPMWMVTFADLMSLLVTFFVLIISFSVADTKKMKIVAGSMRDAFGFQQEMIVTGMVEIDGNPRFEYAKDLTPLPVKDKVGPIPDEGDDIEALSARQDLWEEILEDIEEMVDGDKPIEDAEGEGAESEEPKTKAEREEANFARIEQELREALEGVPELAQLAEHLRFERAAEGLRIQIVDQARMSMFPLGSAQMYGPTKTLLRQVAAAIATLPNRISVAGHTDSLSFRRNDGYDNWSLSLDRADATRRMLLSAGLDRKRVAAVIGKADTDHMLPEAPTDPRNRRISITLLREQPPPPTAE